MGTPSYKPAGYQLHPYQRTRRIKYIIVCMDSFYLLFIY